MPKDYEAVKGMLPPNRGQVRRHPAHYWAPVLSLACVGKGSIQQEKQPTTNAPRYKELDLLY